jgi:integrase/recombinase XerD
MTKARQDFIDHLKLRGFSQRTIENYIKNVAQFARFHKASPDLLNHEHVKQYLLYLRNERKLQIRSINLQFYSLRGYYKDFRVGGCGFCKIASIIITNRPFALA